MEHSGPFVKASRPSLQSFLTDSDYVDPITFVNGPVSREERVQLLKHIGLYQPFTVTASLKDKERVETLGKSCPLMLITSLNSLYLYVSTFIILCSSSWIFVGRRKIASGSHESRWQEEKAKCDEGEDQARYL